MDSGVLGNSVSWSESGPGSGNWICDVTHCN